MYRQYHYCMHATINNFTTTQTTVSTVYFVGIYNVQCIYCTVFVYCVHNIHTVYNVHSTVHFSSSFFSVVKPVLSFLKYFSSNEEFVTLFLIL